MYLDLDTFTLQVKAVRYDGLMLPIHVGQCGLTEPDTRKRLETVRAQYTTVIRKLREAAVSVDPNAQTWFNCFVNSCQIAMLSRFVALSVSLTRKASLLQTWWIRRSPGRWL